MAARVDELEACHWFMQRGFRTTRPEAAGEALSKALGGEEDGVEETEDDTASERSEAPQWQMELEGALREAVTPLPDELLALAGIESADEMLKILTPPAAAFADGTASFNTPRLAASGRLTQAAPSTGPSGVAAALCQPGRQGSAPLALL